MEFLVGLGIGVVVGAISTVMFLLLKSNDK